MLDLCKTEKVRPSEASQPAPPGSAGHREGGSVNQSTPPAGFTPSCPGSFTKLLPCTLPSPQEEVQHKKPLTQRRGRAGQGVGSGGAANPDSTSAAPVSDLPRARSASSEQWGTGAHPECRCGKPWEHARPWGRQALLLEGLGRSRTWRR